MEKHSFEEILAFAIQSEEDAANGYRMASEMVRRSNVKEMLLKMAKQEEGHKIKLQGITIEKLERTEVRRVPDLKIADYADNIEITRDTDYQDLLTVAMKREEKAHNLYTTLASNTDEPELKKLFQVLAQEEAKHKLSLEQEYDEHVLTDN